MVKSYCVKQKKQTECVEPSGYKQAKNGRLMFFCTCAECGITKTKFVKSTSGGNVLSKPQVPAYSKPYCGIKNVPKDKHRGSPTECIDSGGVRLYGIHKIPRNILETMSESQKQARAVIKKEKRKNQGN